MHTLRLAVAITFVAVAGAAVWARRILDAHGRNYVRDWFLRPGVRVQLVHRRATILARRPRYRNVIVRTDTGREEIWWMGNLRIVLALLLAVCTIACGISVRVSRPASGPIVPPAVTDPVRAVALVVRDGDARPLSGAGCALQDVPGWTSTVVTNADGYLVWPTITAGLRQTAIRCHADGFVAYEAPAVLTTGQNETLPDVALQADHVDPSAIPLGELARLRGDIFPRANVCADAPLLPYGPRPGAPDNIIATTYFDNYTPDQQDAVARCLTSVGFTHVAVGGLVDQWAYHGQYVGHDYSTPAGFERFLDQHQWFYDHGLKPVTFIHQDGATLDETRTLVHRLVAEHPRAQRLIRIVVMSGWEPAKYEWSSCTWAGYVALGREAFPNALNLIHTVSDVDAPVGTDALCNDDDHVWNPAGNGAGWQRVISAGLHGWLIQNGPYEAGPTHPDWTDTARQFAAQFKKDGDGALYHGVAWHFGGPGGWTGDSAWGPGIPICLYNAEDTAYPAYWANRPSEPDRAAWGNLAVASGACGYMDGGSVPVPRPR